MRKKTTKTHVFRYESLKPFVRVRPDGDLEVEEYVRDMDGEGKLENGIDRFNNENKSSDNFNNIVEEIVRLRETIENKILGDLPNMPQAELLKLVGDRVREEVINALKGRGELGDEDREYLKQISSVDQILKTMLPNISSIRQTVRLIDDSMKSTESKIDVIERLVQTLIISPASSDTAVRLAELDKKISGLDLGADFQKKISEMVADKLKGVESPETAQYVAKYKDIEDMIRRIDSKIESLGAEVSRVSNPENIKKFVSELRIVEKIREAVANDVNGDAMMKKIIKVEGDVGGLRTEMSNLLTQTSNNQTILDEIKDLKTSVSKMTSNNNIDSIIPMLDSLQESVTNLSIPSAPLSNSATKIEEGVDRDVVIERIGALQKTVEEIQESGINIETIKAELNNIASVIQEGVSSSVASRIEKLDLTTPISEIVKELKSIMKYIGALDPPSLRTTLEDILGKSEDAVKRASDGVDKLNKIVEGLNIPGDVKSVIENMLKEELKTILPQTPSPDTSGLMGMLDGLKVNSDRILNSLTKETLDELVKPYMTSLEEMISKIRAGNDITNALDEIKALIESSSGIIKKDAIDKLASVENRDPQIPAVLREIMSVKDVLERLQPTVESISSAVKILENDDSEVKKAMVKFLNERTNESKEDMVKEIRMLIPEFNENILKRVDQLNKTLVDLDLSVAGKFDDVVSKIEKLNLGGDIDRMIKKLNDDSEITRSEFYNTLENFKSSMSVMAEKKDVEILKNIMDELIRIKSSVNGIDVSSGVNDVAKKLSDKLDEIRISLKTDFQDSMPVPVDIPAMTDDYKSHVTEESQRVIDSIKSGITPEEMTVIINDVKAVLGDMSKLIEAIPTSAPEPVDMSGVEGSINGLKSSLEESQAERQRIYGLIDELKGIKAELNNMITGIYENLVDHHDKKTEILLDKMNSMSIDLAKSEQIETLIEKFDAIEKMLRKNAGTTDEKIDTIDSDLQMVDKLEKLEEQMKSIFEDLGVDNYQSAQQRIQDMIKRSESSSKPTVYTSLPNINDLLKYDEGEMNKYKEEESIRFVQMGIDMFGLRKRYTDLIHMSVYIHESLLKFNNPPKSYETELTEPILEASSSELSQVMVLKDAFSEAITPDDDSGDMTIASIFQRVINIEKVVGLVASSNIGSELVPLMKRRGVQIREGYHMYMIDDLFDVVFFLINNTRQFINTAMTKEALASGIPARYTLVNAFIDALVQSVSKIRMLNDIGGRIDSQLTLPNHVLSYVKIRADRDSIDSRYSVHYDTRHEKLLLAHEPYVTSSLSVNKLNNYYQYDVYGPHTRVFTPKEGNSDMGSNMNELVEQIDSGKSVMLITFGPSGSGKTSTILYFRNENKPGILPLVLKRVDATKYRKAELVGYELATNYDKNGNMYWDHHNVFDEPLTMKRDVTNEWIVEKTDSNKVMDYKKGVCEIPNPYDMITRKEITIDGGKSIGDVMADVIDMRLNCGTKNNPFSSRTHLFIFFKIEGGPTLIVGDLAGRENSFDCTSFETLMNLTNNKNFYPGLYNIVSDVDEIEKRITNPAQEKRPKSYSELKNISGSSLPKAPKPADGEQDDLFPPTDIDDAVKLVGKLKIPEVFSKLPTSSKGYIVMPIQSGGKNVLNKKFYIRFSNLMKYIGDFKDTLIKRIEDMDSQLPPIKKALEPLLKYNRLITTNNKKLQDLTYIDVVSEILVYMKGFPIGGYFKDGIFDSLTFGRRVMGTDIGDGEFNESFKLVPRMIKYLMVSKCIEELVMNGEAKNVCGVRNVEGKFINRSLDEITDFARMLVLTGSDSRGPPVHETCLPISCGFAGMDCLLPKRNVSVDVKSVLRVMFEKVNIKLEPETTCLCLMTVLNVTTPDTHRVPPVYNPLEDILERIFAAYSEKERLRSTYFEDLSTFNYIEFENSMTNLMNLVERENGNRDEYRRRKEYMGSTESMMLKVEDRKRLYDKSTGNWNDIKTIGERVVGMFSNFYREDSRLTRYMTDVVRSTINKYHYINTETVPGTLRTCEYIMKASEHLPCSVDDIDTLLRPNDTWISAPAKVTPEMM